MLVIYEVKVKNTGFILTRDMTSIFLYIRGPPNHLKKWLGGKMYTKNRRKYKDNPYTLSYDENKFLIEFNKNKVNVTKDIYDLFDLFELHDLKELNEYDNHIEHSELCEFTLERRRLHKSESLEDLIIKKIANEVLYDSINKLNEKDRMRIIMYYFNDMTLQEIAKLENISHQAVSKSIKKSLIELKRIINEGI